MALSLIRAFIVLVLWGCAPTRIALGQPVGQDPPQASTQVPVSWPSRVFIDVGGGLHLSSVDFEETHKQEAFVEESTWQAQYLSKQAPQLDAGIGVRVGPRVLVAVSYSQHRDTEPVAVSGQIPHPFFFNQPRLIEGTSQPLGSDEQALHLGVSYVAPVGRRFEITLSAGPSIFRSKRSFINDVRFAQEYPFDTATFDGVTTVDVRRNAFGGHGAADVTWLITRHVGLGALVRVSGGSFKFATPSGGSLNLNAGGIQTVAGLRLRLGSVRPPQVRGRQSPATLPSTEYRSPEAGTQRQAAQYRSAVMISTAPVFLLPDAKRVPLRTLDIGTTVKLLEEAGDWLKVEFPDRLLGPRVGYVERRHVQTAK